MIQEIIAIIDMTTTNKEEGSLPDKNNNGIDDQQPVLFYFHVLRQAEPICILLHIAGINVKDTRVPFEEWPAENVDKISQIQFFTT
jgi:hypothetical protein